MKATSDSRFEYGPERLDGQGLDPNQYESGDAAIRVLLADEPAANQTDLVMTFRAGAYEVWSRRGMIRFKRFAGLSGLAFEVIEQRGENPIANQDPFALPDLENELAAAARSGFRTTDVNSAWIEPSAITYPHAYERIAQLFDSPRAPDLIVSPKCYCYGVQPGQHGALDIVQSRAPLMFAGPGIKPGKYPIAARHVDIAPTIARLMNFPLIDGRDFTGRTATEREHSPDVYLKRQDGRVLDEIIDGAAKPSLVYMILLDGLSNSELRYMLAKEPGRIPNLGWLADRAAFLEFGSTVNFPSITWPSHSAILTGAWSGHHDIVGPTYYVRETRTIVPAQGQVFDTAQFLGEEVETLYEAFKRVFGQDTFTISIHEPQSRGADHAAWERRVLGERTRLKALTNELMDVNPRWKADDKLAVEREEIVDIRGLAQLLTILEEPTMVPRFVAHELVVTDGAGHDYGPHHEAIREALCASDRRIGIVFDTLKRRGLFDSTLFVVTADHGMAAQNIELRANPTCAPRDQNIKGVYAEPMIYLRDMAIEVIRARDGRTVRVEVRDNDADASGNHLPIASASVIARDKNGNVLGGGKTDQHGLCAIATPANLGDDQIVIEIEHSDFNRRHLRADGAQVAADLRQAIFQD